MHLGIIFVSLITGVVLSAQAQPLRQFDFRNFEYTAPAVGDGAQGWFTNTAKKTVRLRNGVYRDFFDRTIPANQLPSYSIVGVTFGDLDGDGADEAAVDLIYSGGGSGHWHYLHIFTTAPDHQRLIAGFKAVTVVSEG